MSRTVSPNEHSCAHNLTPEEISARRVWNTTEMSEAPELDRKLVGGPAAFDYEGYVRVIAGRGTVCIPLAAAGDLPSPQQTSGAGAASLGTSSGPLSPVTNLAIQDPQYQEDFGLSQGLNYELIPPEEIQQLWNKVVQDSSNRIAQGAIKDSQREDREKMKKLERLLTIALNSGNIDLAMLLISGLETKEVNAVATNLMGRMRELQQERRSLIEQLPPPKGTSSTPGTSDAAAKSSAEADDAKNTNILNQKIANVGTEIQFLQTFLQDIMSQKNEAQQMASNYLKSKHDTATSIVRNMA